MESPDSIDQENRHSNHSSQEHLEYIPHPRMAYEKAPDCQHFHQYESHQQAEFSGQKSNQMHTPLQSQYNHLVNKRDGSYSAVGQPRWAGSNGFRMSQN